VDKITHIQCLKERKYFIVSQDGLTKDNKIFGFDNKKILYCMEKNYADNEIAKEMVE